MAITIGGGINSYRAMANMKKTSALMNKSLERISSGLRINSASDDAGGLALGMKLSNDATVTSTIQQNVANAKSFVDTQSTALQTASEILTEMKTLKTSHDSGTASDADKAGYESEFQELRTQLSMLTSEKYNGKALFGTAGTAETVNTSSDGGGGGVEIGGLDLEAVLGDLADPSVAKTLVSTTSVELDVITDGDSGTGSDGITQLIGKAAGDSSSLGFASSYLESKAANLEAARSRVMDADIVEESTNLSLYTIQYEASVAALAQANSTQQTVMELLLFPNNN
jgi:flagellin